MELSIDDFYSVKGDPTISEDSLVSLCLLYQPMIGRDGLALYLTLYAQSSQDALESNFRQLSALLDMDIDGIEKAMIRLEEFHLLRTFSKPKKGDRTLYLFALEVPLSTALFLGNRTWVGLYEQAADSSLAAKTLQLLSKHGVDHSFEEVTHPVRYGDALTKVRPQKEESAVDEVFAGGDQQINFDYERFLETTTPLVFPTALRTRSRMRLIGQLATVYGISVDRMRILVGKAVDPEKEIFDEEKLRFLAAREKPTVTSAADPYSLPPLSFLQSKMNGAAVPLVDRRLLEHLAVDMHFSSEVINILIEYVLSVSNNKLVPKFVDMVAGEWARDGVSSREAALAERNKKNESRRSRTEVLPAYYYEQKDDAQPQTNSEEDSALIDRKALLEEMRRAAEEK